MLLAAMVSPAQLTVYEVSFPADIGHHWSVLILSLVGTGDSLFPGLRVVKGGQSMSTGTKLYGSLDGEAWFFTSSCVFSHKRALRMERLSHPSSGGESQGKGSVRSPWPGRRTSDRHPSHGQPQNRAPHAQAAYIGTGISPFLIWCPERLPVASCLFSWPMNPLFSKICPTSVSPLVGRIRSFVNSN